MSHLHPVHTVRTLVTLITSTTVQTFDKFVTRYQTQLHALYKLDAFSYPFLVSFFLLALIVTPIILCTYTLEFLLGLPWSDLNSSAQTGVFTLGALLAPYITLYVASPALGAGSYVLSYVVPTSWQVFLSFLPEITLAVMIVYLLSMMSTELSRNRAAKTVAIECWRAACCGLAFIALIYAIQLCGNIGNSPAFSGYLYISYGLTASKLLVALSSLFVLQLSGSYIREHAYHAIEFSIVIMIGALFLLILVSSNNLMLTFFALAGFSLNLYILVLYDGIEGASREAAIKYFYLSAFSAGLILFGTLLIYAMLGDVTYGVIRFLTEDDFHPRDTLVVNVGVVFVLLGFLFKLSAFPGHLWAVEVYAGSPMPVMALFILPVKVAVFLTLMRLLNTGFITFSSVWLPCITVAVLGSLLWGALAATQERKVIRFLGYASINQIGYLLLGLVLDTDDGLRSSFFYLMLYAIMTAGALLIITQLRGPNGATVVAISDLRGLGKNEWLATWHLSIFLFSMAGIPPLAGFFGKYYLLLAATEKGLFAIVFVGLAVSLITTYYYLRIIKTIWFEEDIATRKFELRVTDEQRTLLSVLESFLWGAAIVATIILPGLDQVVVTLTLCGDTAFSV